MRREAPSLLWLLLRVIALVSVVLLVQRPPERSLGGDGVSRLLQSDACAVGAVRPAQRLVLGAAPPPAPPGPRALSWEPHGAFTSGPVGLLALATAPSNPAPRQDFPVSLRRRIPRLKLADPPLSLASAAPVA